MLDKPKISKSEYVKGKQCPKALWFSRYRQDLKLEIDSATQVRFDIGNEVGQLAMQYFEGGIKVTDNYWEIEKAVSSTQNFINQGHEVIFEATAVHPLDGSYSRIDVLRKVPNSDEWDLIEVKSSTSLKDYYIHDMSFQHYVFCGSGYKIRQHIIMLIDNTYVREGDIDTQKLFKFENISSQVFDKQEEVRCDVIEFGDILVDCKDEPDIEIGERCFDPFECEYRHHCWKHIPKYSVFNIYPKKKVNEIIENIGSYDIKDIPSNLFPKGVKAIDVECYQNDEENIDKTHINQWLSKLEYPLYYLDYETFMPAIPLFNNTHPYQKIPSQFSLHIQESPNAELKHFEFIHKEQSDPREHFIKALVEVCGKSGSVIVYNQSFELGCNRELATDFPKYAGGLLAINERVVDMMEPFKKRWLYSPKQQSSASIKYVLPAFTDLKYEGMSITNGQEAMDKYLDFAKWNIPQDQLCALWNDLSEYCKLDTYAMVELLSILKKMVMIQKKYLK